MADEKLNTGPAENISPEAAEPITTPEQAAAADGSLCAVQCYLRF
ncbi:hypothetical protein [Gemmiger formicilis]